MAAWMNGTIFQFVVEGFELVCLVSGWISLYTHVSMIPLIGGTMLRLQ